MTTEKQTFVPAVGERRNSIFAEKLSTYIVVIAALGAFLVLLDPRAEIVIGAQKFAFGGDGFSSELKGAVITIMLIGGWTAAVSYWLGNTESGKKQQESISRIAEAAPVPPTPLQPIVVPVVPAPTPASGTGVPPQGDTQ